MEARAAVAERDLRVVGLSVVYVDDPDRIAEGIRQVRNALPADVALVIGGSGVARIRERLAAVDVQVAEDLVSFVAALRPLTERR